MSQQLRIAISGGGLAGAAIANALLKHQHIRVDIYESAPEFSERGAAIGLAINAQKALNEIVPPVGKLLDEIGAVKMSSTRIMIGCGAAAGTHVLDVAEEKPGKMVHRAALLQALLAPIPGGCKHAGKKLVSIDTNVQGQSAGSDSLLTLKFQDGSQATADVLIGADGIFSSVRGYVLGPDDPVTKPVPAGWVGTNAMVPFSMAREKLGPHYFEEDRQYAWVGEKGIFIHSRVNNGELVMCIGTVAVDVERAATRRHDVTRESLEASYSSWMDGPVTRGMIDLLLTQETPAGYSQFEQQDAPRYFKGNVCIAGDAAHAMTPWQGSGAAAAIEDAVILGELFGHVESPNQVENALRAFDVVRRPRTQRIAESSRLTGRIISGIDEKVGLDPVKMKEALKSRWDFIYDFDLAKHKADALAELERKI